MILSGHIPDFLTGSLILYLSSLSSCARQIAEKGWSSVFKVEVPNCIKYSLVMPVLVGLEYPNIKRLHARVRTAGKEKGTILWRLAGRINCGVRRLLWLSIKRGFQGFAGPEVNLSINLRRSAHQKYGTIRLSEGIRSSVVRRVRLYVVASTAKRDAYRISRKRRHNTHLQAP